MKNAVATAPVASTLLVGSKNRPMRGGDFRWPLFYAHGNLEVLLGDDDLVTFSEPDSGRKGIFPAFFGEVPVLVFALPSRGGLVVEIGDQEAMDFAARTYVLGIL